MTPLPSCPAFKVCGGCKYNDLPYERQLAEKQKRLEKLLGSFCAVSEIRGMTDPLHYRHKVHQVLTRTAQGQFLGGYYAAGSHKVVTVPSCRLDDEECQAVIGTICRLAKELGLNPNTVAKAYSMLERDGIIYSAAGRGCFVATQQGNAHKRLETELLDKLTEALRGGIDRQRISELIDEAEKNM